MIAETMGGGFSSRAIDVRRSSVWPRIDTAARASWPGSHPQDPLAPRMRSRSVPVFRNEAFFVVVEIKIGGVTVSTGSIAAWEACRGVGTRNRLQKQSCQR